MNCEADEEGPESARHKICNGLGLYDVSGNVWEWCWGWYLLSYYGTRPDPDSDPTGASGGSSRVLRGGGWCSSAHSCRSARRCWN